MIAYLVAGMVVGQVIMAQFNGRPDWSDLLDGQWWIGGWVVGLIAVAVIVGMVQAWS